VLYEDDGKSLDYQHGKFAVTKVRSSGTNIEIDKPVGEFTSRVHSYVVRMHGVSRPPAVEVNGKAVANLIYDAPSRVLSFTVEIH
jgi:alpha-glucosidase